MASSPLIHSFSSNESSQMDLDALSPLSETQQGMIKQYNDGYISSPSLSKSETQDSLQWKFGQSPRKIAARLFAHPEEDIPAVDVESYRFTHCDNVPNDQFRAGMRNAESKLLKGTTLIESSGLLEMALQTTSFEFYQKVGISFFLSLSQCSRHLVIISFNNLL